MSTKLNKDRNVFEIMLIVVTLGMTYLLYQMGGHKMVALNLFFLPIVLSGYYLGRTSAGILALFSTLSVTVATTLDSTGFAAYTNPVMVGLALTVWAAVLGLTAILVGTLCDEREAKVDELHAAYIGVVEVLSKYLQSGNPKIKARSVRIAEMCQLTAEEMRLSRKQIDDIRVGALLHDLGNVEITTKLISKAVDTLEADPMRSDKHTFLGMDLVHSLGSVLHGAVPLLMSQDDPARDGLAMEDEVDCGEIPLGTRIIRAVRAFEALTVGDLGEAKSSSARALLELRKAPAGEFDDEVLNAIERMARRSMTASSSPEPAFG
jgi:HD-GYP domain-containing protein (c-di-GMP phosphodiesterase class II)